MERLEGFCIADTERLEAGSDRRELARRGVTDPGLTALADRERARDLQRSMQDLTDLSAAEISEVLEVAASGAWLVSLEAERSALANLQLSPERMTALRNLDGVRFDRAWQFEQALAKLSPAWRPRPDDLTDREWNQELNSQLSLLLRVCRVDQRRE